MTCFSLAGNITRLKLEYHEKALAISKEIGHRKGEAAGYGNLGSAFHSLSEYIKAKECREKGLAISIEIGHREREKRHGIET